jgi:hydroxyacylglutathione hydrolase
MKRVLIIVGIVLLVLIAIPVTVFVSAFAGTQAIPDGKELTGGAQIIKDGFTSAVLIPIGGRDVALVDAGGDKEGKAILAALAKRNLGPGDVKAVFLTHGHQDHIAAIPLFPNAQVMALAAEVDLVEGGAGPKGPVTHFFGVHPTGIKVSRALKDGETVQVGNASVQIFAVPGHTEGSAAFLIAGTLYLGDSAGATADGKLKPAVWAFSDDAAQNHASLKALAARLKPQSGEIKFLETAHSGAMEGFAPLETLAGTL